MSAMLSKKQEKIQRKELQKFFDKITHLMLVPKGHSNAPISGLPALFIVMKEHDFKDAKHYSINKTIETLLDNKYPVLYISIDEETRKVTYSIQDKESGMKFNLITLDVTQPLADFLKVADFTDKLPMLLLGQKDDEALVSDEAAIQNVLLFIDGYFIE